MAGMVK